MKKLMMALVLSGICCFTTEKIMAFDINSVCHTCTKNKFGLNGQWKLIDFRDDSFEFEHRNNENVELEISIGSKFSENVNLDDLQAEIEDYLIGITDNMPILEYSFALGFQGYADDDDWEGDNILEDEDEDDEWVWDEDLYNEDDEWVWDDNLDDDDDVDIQDISEFSTVEFGGVTWLNFQFTSPVIITTYTPNGSYVDKEFQRNNLFFCMIHNRLYMVTFTAPLEDYFDYEISFQETVPEISNYINNM
jgi:hypothetical protein